MNIQKKDLLMTVLFLAVSFNSFGQIDKQAEGVLGFDFFNIEKEADTVLMQFPFAGKYILNFSEQDIGFESIELNVEDINYNKQEFRKEGPSLILEIEKPAHLRFIYQLKDEKLLNAAVNVGIIYPLRPRSEVETFVVSDIQGSEISMDSLRGKVVVLNYWSTGCKPCVEEMPNLNKLSKFYKDREDIVFLAVNPDTKSRTLKFLERHEFNYKIISGIKNTDHINISTGFKIIPFHVIIDKQGKVAFNLYGGQSGLYEILKHEIEAIL